MLDIVPEKLSLNAEQRRWHRERRSAWLRLMALAILVVNLGLAGKQDSGIVHANVVVVYGALTITALILAELRKGTKWLSWLYVVFDAMLVVVLFHEHLFAPGKDLDHTLTAPSLAIGFVLLTHVALRLRPVLVFLFSGLVILGWLALLTVAVEAHLGKGSAHALNWSAFLTEAALAAAFGFAALVCGLLTHEHNALLKTGGPGGTTACKSQSLLLADCLDRAASDRNLTGPRSTRGGCDVRRPAGVHQYERDDPPRNAGQAPG